MQERLFTPGPTPLPPEVISAMSKPIIHHRHVEFKTLMERVLNNLKYVFRTNRDVYVITGSGTAAMEAAVCNLLSIGDEVLVVNAGKFGQRWSELNKAFGAKVTELKIEWGKPLDTDLLGGYLKAQSKIKAVFLTQCETSTGVQHDIKTAARIIRNNSDALIVVDAISSLAGTEFFTDEWRIDVVVSASQKGLMTPPGLSFITLSEKAQEKVFHSNIKKYYFDIKKGIESQSKFLTPWTPATTLIMGLDVALNMIRNSTLENIWERNRNFSSIIRNKCLSIGLKLFAESPSDILTAVCTPETIIQKNLLNTLKNKYNVIVAGGQGDFKDKIFRISNIGYLKMDDIECLLEALEGVFNILPKSRISIENT